MNQDNWPDPSPEMLASPDFAAVWECIKDWDIAVSKIPGQDMYSEATGNHVKAILDSIALSKADNTYEDR